MLSYQIGMKENSLFDRKSLKIIQGKKADWKELAKDCVSFANAVGGEIHIGIEINKRTLKRKLDDLVIDKLIKKTGKNKGRKYAINIKT